ncbi:SitI3 family protein [Kitasatospora purpeofusca]|uniref:SitI3 family protein n=1 Tax=Kitasatospora purpeofusca TaxID=67352 RepID=UPI0036D305D0
MAISHYLDLATRTPLPDVARSVLDAGHVPGLVSQLLDDGVLTASGTWIRAVDANPRPWSPDVTDLGITATVTVAFRLAKNDDMTGQDDDIIRLVARLLARIDGDAVLKYHGETIWLLRRNGDLSLHERADLWPDRRLAAFADLPHHRRTHTYTDA